MPAVYLEEFQSWLASLHRPVVSVLVPGVEPADVRAALGVNVPQAVVEWFGWCNGVAHRSGQTNDDVAVIPGYSPVSLDEAVRLRPTYDGDPLLSPNWVPLLASAGGDLYAAVWSVGSEASVAGTLVGEPTVIEFTSIQQMVSVFSACFARSAFYVDDRQHFAINPDLYDEVYAELVS